MTTSDNNKNISASDNNLVEDNRLLGIKLSLAQGFVQMLLTAYDALLHHGINYRDLPEFKDETLLDAGRKAPAEEGRVLMLDWLARLGNGIAAAVRRKGFKKV